MAQPHRGSGWLVWAPRPSHESLQQLDLVPAKEFREALIVNTSQHAPAFKPALLFLFCHGLAVDDEGALGTGFASSA